MAVMGVSGRRWHCSNKQPVMLRRSSRNTSAREHEKIGSAVWQAIYCSIGGGLLFLRIFVRVIRYLPP